LRTGETRLAAPKALRPHQQEALEAVQEGLAQADRGKLIMACGTGKTFTGLKIAETLGGPGKTVLILVPSLALMSQTIREWTIDSATPLRSFAVCSDVAVGKRRRDADDLAEIELHDLDYPATTDAAKLASRSSAPAPDRMTVVFSTYQSIQVISDAQKRHGFPEFDLIICDEAHRTTGATLAGEDESNFVKIHNNDFIAGKKRLYMTATPRVFGDAVKAKANEASAELASMDNEDLYGPTLFTRVWLGRRKRAADRLQGSGAGRGRSHGEYRRAKAPGRWHQRIEAGRRHQDHRLLQGPDQDRVERRTADRSRADAPRAGVLQGHQIVRNGAHRICRGDQ
jgi:predicted helicase